MAANNDVKSGSILEWIDDQHKQMATSKSVCGSNLLSMYITHLASDCVASQILFAVAVV